MNIIVKGSIISTIAAVLIGFALAGPAVAQPMVPFKGTMHGVEIGVVDGATMLVDGSGKGVGTQLGRFTVYWDATVNLVDGTATGSFELVAANGDRIFATHVGLGTPTGIPNVFDVVEIGTITGGTGRFAGASGSFVVERVVDLSTGISTGGFRGTLSAPGGKG
jgi:hypothetical protein